jgi:UTP:GlnB (protein PII) uridylyltransferase
MRRYGVLGRYIPEFGRVIGQMQHDLFHIYTVDAHTMMVIRNMRRLHYRSSQEKFPVAYHCVKSLPKIELLYIAGSFTTSRKGAAATTRRSARTMSSRFVSATVSAPTIPSSLRGSSACTS